MTQQMLGVLTNPNLLFFAANGSYAPTGITNVVVNGTAQQIVLQDPEGDTKANFYSPRTFTAASITYSHVYTLTSGINGEVLGWETIALPFIVQKIEHRQKGILTMFSRYDAKNASQRPFWLYRYGENGFVPASQIDANRAFLICMPNNPEYDDEYNLAGEVSFSATNVQVLRTGYVNMQQRGNKKFMPVFCHTKKSSSIYAMNINDASRPGSAFVSNSRDLKPFEAYMTTDQVGARPVFEIDFEDANAIADALMPTASRYTVYSLSGQLLVKTDSQNEYQKALDLLPAGIYIVNGKKQQIKK
jgi:hypothetical protein